MELGYLIPTTTTAAPSGAHNGAARASARTVGIPRYPSSMSSRRAPSFNEAAATAASLYDVLIKGVLAATVPIGRSVGRIHR
jgi:hypothetical protein